MSTHIHGRDTRIATCPLCEASCGILVDCDGGRIRSIRGDPEDPFSKGYICPKAAALADLHDDPDRIRTPLVRQGARWREASWQEALDRAAHAITRVQRLYGRHAVAIYYGNPVAHNLGLMTHALPFARALRTKNVYSASSADQLPQMLVALRMFGHQALIPVPDLDRTGFLLVIGANPIVSNGSLMTAPNVRRRLRAIRDRGGRIVVVDPRRTETAEVADQHIAIRPGTDALFIAALLHVVFANGWLRLGRFEERVRHLDALAAFAHELSPERVERRTGVSAEVTRQLAEHLAQTDRAACYGRVGLCTQRFGTIANWLLQALNLVTGHVDDPGGMMMTTPAVDVVSILSWLRRRGTFGRWRSRVRSLPEFGGELPIATLADEIETHGTDRVRGLITIAGNPVLSAPNGRRLDHALSTLDCVVSIDPYLNETTRHAHVLLPPASPLARPQYDLALYAFAVRNIAKYSEAAFARGESEQHDWEILAALAGRVFVPAPFQGVADRVFRMLRPEYVVDLLLRAGPYRLSLRKLRAAPHGLDLGPLRPGRLADVVATEDGKVDLAPSDFVREARARLFADVDLEGNELVLVGRRELRSHNSWMHNSHRLVKGPARCTLLVHPLDAEARALTDGGLATLESEAGAITVSIEVTDSVRPGVVSLPHGWGHDRDGVRLTIAREHPGVSVNDVTSERELDALSGNAAFNGLPVVLRPSSRARAV